MAKSPSPEQAVEAARRLQDDRLGAVRSLAEAQQRIEDVQEQTEAAIAQAQRSAAEQRAAASRTLTQTYQAALKAGWSAAELRSIGYPDPGKAKRRSPAKAR